MSFSTHTGHDHTFPGRAVQQTAQDSAFISLCNVQVAQLQNDACLERFVGVMDEGDSN